MPGGEEAQQSSSSSSDISSARSGALFALPPPAPLDIRDSNAAEKWKEFEQAWRNHSVTMKLQQEFEAVQIATLLTVIGAEARKVFSTFTFDGDNRDRIQLVLESFAAYYQPLKNVPFERYKFYSRKQEAGDRMTIIGQPFDNQLIDANLKPLRQIKFYGTSLFSEYRIQRYERDCFAKRICHCGKLMKFVGRTRQ